MQHLFAYRDAEGREPFNKWFAHLDAQAAAKVRSALAQLEAGNRSEVKPIGAGVSERRVHWGNGLRIYFGQDGRANIILLGGGMKDTHARDVRLMVARWKDFKQR
jgi:putative addiction module killer protein